MWIFQYCASARDFAPRSSFWSPETALNQEILNILAFRITLIPFNLAHMDFPCTGLVPNHWNWPYLGPQTTQAQTNWWIQKLQSSWPRNNSLCLYSIALWSQFFEPCVKSIARQRAILGPGEVFRGPETSPNPKIIHFTCWITLCQLRIFLIHFPSDPAASMMWIWYHSNSTNSPSQNEYKFQKISMKNRPKRTHSFT